MNKFTKARGKSARDLAKSNRGAKADLSRNQKMALALTAIFTGGLVTGTLLTSKLQKNKDNKKYVIASVVDLPKDNYIDEIPMKTGRKQEKMVPENSIVLVKGAQVSKSKNEVMYLSAEDRVSTGTIKGKYLDEFVTISSEELEQYNTLYKVLPEEGANLRTTPDFNIDTNKISGILGGEVVLGGIPVATADNGFLWIPTLYINEHGIEIGYIREDLLGKIGENVFSKNYEEVELPTEETVDLQPENIDRTMIVNTRRDGGINLKLREAPNGSSEVLTEIVNGEEVVISEEDFKNIVQNDDNTWVKVSVQDLKGYVDITYLKEKEEEVQIEPEEVVQPTETIQKLMVVNTAENNGIALDLMSEPNVKSDVLLRMENGYQFAISDEDLNNIIKKGRRKWVKINIQGIEGYADTAYLEGKIQEIVPEEEKKSEISVKLNENGKVVGIDSDGRNLTAADIDSYVCRGVLQDVAYSDNIGDTVDISDLKNNIGFMYIKLGATRTDENFSISEAGYNADLIKKCEEYGIPYGFYYFTGSRTPEEAEKEFEYIEKIIENKERRRFNLLPFAIDCEIMKRVCDLDNPEARTDVTDAMIRLTNKLKESGEEVILYTSGAATVEPKTSILNLGRYYTETGINDLWFVMPRQDIDGNLWSNLDYYNVLPEYMNVLVTQDAQEVGINLQNGNTVSVDYDTMAVDTFKKLILKKNPNIEFVVDRSRYENYDYDK